MLIMNRSPLQPFEHIHDEIDQLFNLAFGNGRILRANSPLRAPATPPMNVWEHDGTYFIEAELPGYSMDHLHIDVFGDQVRIKGERAFAAPEKATYLRRERSEGSFQRTWTFPAEIDVDRVEASLNDGVLLITLPKNQKALPRKIAVKPAAK